MRSTALAPTAPTAPAVPAVRPAQRGRHPTPTAAATAGTAAADPEHQDAIAESHERCAALGVSRIDTPDLGPVPRSELSIALERTRRLHEHAAPVMAVLHDQIERTESMVVLTDSQGTVIHAIGDDDFLQRASKVALRAGANWSESSKGTNAVGTALIDERPTLVHADEHYLHANSFLTCSAAPILDPRGNILGVLDVSGDFRSYHRHTLALVRMSARMIENRWLTEDYGRALRLHFHARPEYIGTIMEGILAVTEGGRIAGANRGALEQLGLSGAAVRMHTLSTLFDVALEAVVDHCRQQVSTPLVLRLANGQVLSGFARCAWPVHGAPAAVATALGSRAAVGHASAARAERAESPRVAQEPAGPPRAQAGGALERLRGGDTRFAAVLDKARQVLDRDVSVFIVGETGTGKEWLARAMHADSARAAAPFVAVNCTASNATALEAELFCAAGGKLGEARGGTLLLDDVGDMPLAVQGQLLRALGTGEPAGGLALICTSRHKPRELLTCGAFREDLYYRLNGLSLWLPPLRERSDMDLLIARIARAAGALSAQPLAPAVRELFQVYGWPGNLRQLHQVLRAAVLMAGPQGTITTAHLPDDFLQEAQAVVATRQAAAHPPDAPDPAAPGRTVDAMELELIRRTLDAVGGNISEASKRLGISRNTIYRKLRWNAPTQLAPH